MKRLSLIFIALIITGCAANAMKTIRSEITSSMQVGGENKAGVGDTFFSLVQLDGTYGMVGEFYCNKWGSGCSRYDLTVTGLNEKDLVLQYSEFFLDDAGSWLIKQGFNKTFTYSPKETIRFKGYEFESISVINGQITYKRVK